MENQAEIRVITDQLKYPEGPVTLSDGSVYVVEMAGGCVSRVAPDGTVTVIADTGGGPNGLALGPEGKLFVCNNGGLTFERMGNELRSVHGQANETRYGSIQRVDPVSGQVDVLYTHCGENRLSAPNDLVFDEEGGFYFTDFGRTRHRLCDIGAIYYAQPDGSKIEEIVHPIANPNGIGLSPDGSILYVSETETARLWAYPIISPGKLKLEGYPSPNGGRLVYGAPGYHRFDSLAVLANGDICVATVASGLITVIGADGNLIRTIPMPDRHTTNIAFGGADLRTAYITLTMTGKLVAMDWDEPGLELYFAA